MKFIIPIKDTAKLPDIDEVKQFLGAFAKMYPDVIEGIETDLLNFPQGAKNGEDFRESIKTSRKCAITHP